MNRQVLRSSGAPVALVLNARKLPLDRTLGVAFYALSLCVSLAKHLKVFVAVPSVSDALESPFHELLTAVGMEVIALSDVNKLRREFCLVELCPHHFQKPEFSNLSCLICHDLHVFDVDWKYQEPSSMQNLFRECLRSASVVVTEFPRTYYAVEKIAGVCLSNLFLIDSPPLLDTRCASGMEPKSDPPIVLYPAQIQSHKNHLGLLEGFKQYLASGRRALLQFSGTEFGPAESKQVVDYIKANGLDSSVEFLGRLSNDEMISAYGNASAIISPSFAEGGAYIAMEAVLANRPVALSRIDAALLHTAQHAIKCDFFDPKDPKAIVDVFSVLLSTSREEFARANSAALSRLSEISWDTAATKLVHIIRWLVGLGPRPQMRCDLASYQIEFD
ncbi:MAG: glycosyltransferase [Pseudomonadota bacterium]